ncbi:MAG: ATP-binding protein [Saprospiraceae bacterium]
MDFKKAIVLLGPRQVGKSTLIQKIANESGLEFLIINADNPAERLLWTNPDFELIKSLIAPFKLIIFDEAQRIENIGLTCKMIIDAGSGHQVIITGSSALGLGDQIYEPLTGRKWDFEMYPVAWEELSNTYTLAKALPMLENLMIYGSYPDVINHSEDKAEVLESLAGSYLYKDVLELGGIRKPEILTKLLQALAWQVGSEVSFHELSKTLGIDKETVSKYIDLLEKSFVIFRLGPLARNERKEISTSRKIYFYDNGIRNAIIGNFKPLSQRNDVGPIWENFIIAERLKKNSYHKLRLKTWFWRNKSQAEIDYIEESPEGITAFELKWSEKKKAKFSTSFTDFYQPSGTQVINRQNYWKYL